MLKDFQASKMFTMLRNGCAVASVHLTADYCSFQAG
jgi:hypothetical protein